MKKIIIIALTLIAFTTAEAQTNKTAKTETTTTQTVKADTKATPALPTAAATDDSANYVGTNDFNLALIREGIRKG
jgi:myo-inositol-hexaphosphate 3-phosphohydrolase